MYMIMSALSTLEHFLAHMPQRTWSACGDRERPDMHCRSPAAAGLSKRTGAAPTGSAPDRTPEDFLDSRAGESCQL